MRKRIYYKSLDEDVVTNSGQDFKLPENYEWVRREWWAKLAYSGSYFLVKIVSFVYIRIILGIRMKGREKFRLVPKEQGIFIYSNHTMEVGDVFLPVSLAARKRCRTIVSQANLGLPVIGRILPWLGALPIGDSQDSAKKLMSAVRERLDAGEAIMIFPEAHVWPYYTGIRPMTLSAFHHQASLDAPCFTSCTSYRRRRHGSRPKITVTIDGPFYPLAGASQRERRENLRQKVTESLTKGAKASNYSYFEYIYSPKNEK
jgi:1-acyl-sn-glycerol-3-phosphate acyltransferase